MSIESRTSLSKDELTAIRLIESYQIAFHLNQEERCWAKGVQVAICNAALDGWGGRQIEYLDDDFFLRCPLDVNKLVSALPEDTQRALNKDVLLVLPNSKQAMRWLKDIKYHFVIHTILKYLDEGGVGLSAKMERVELYRPYVRGNGLRVSSLAKLLNYAPFPATCATSTAPAPVPPLIPATYRVSNLTKLLNYAPFPATCATSTAPDPVPPLIPATYTIPRIANHSREKTRLNNIPCFADPRSTHDPRSPRMAFTPPPLLSQPTRCHDVSPEVHRVQARATESRVQHIIAQPCLPVVTPMASADQTMVQDRSTKRKRSGASDVDLYTACESEPLQTTDEDRRYYLRSASNKRGRHSLGSKRRCERDDNGSGTTHSVA